MCCEERDCLVVTRGQTENVPEEAVAPRAIYELIALGGRDLTRSRMLQPGKAAVSGVI